MCGGDTREKEREKCLSPGAPVPVEFKRRCKQQLGESEDCVFHGGVFGHGWDLVVNFHSPSTGMPRNFMFSTS